MSQLVKSLTSPLLFLTVCMHIMFFCFCFFHIYKEISFAHV